MSVNNSTPRFEDFNELELSKLLSFDLMFALVNIENWTDMLFGLRIINDLLIIVNLRKSDSNKIVEESLSFN